jgi:hypothetical protein
MLRFFTPTVCVGTATSALACGLATTGLLDSTDARSGDGGSGRLILGDSAPDQGPSDGDGSVLRSEASTGPSTDGQAARGPLPVWDGGAIGGPAFLDTDWVRFCVALAACGQVPYVSACVARLPQPFSPEAWIPPPSLVTRVIGAGPACANVGLALGDGSKCPSTTPDVCSGDSLVTCRWGFKVTIDCGSVGMTCVPAGANPGCGFGRCIASQEGATYCVGPDHLVECRGGRYVDLLNCQTLGGACGGAPGAARCQGAGAPGCTGAPTCIGTSIDVCLAGQRGSADCAALYNPSFACLLGDGGVPICSGGAACDPAGFADACMGMSSLAFCNAGAIGHFSCRAGGYRGCSGGICTP